MTSISSKKGCTIGQLALAWLTAQGSDIIPIPGLLLLHTSETYLH